MPGHGTGSDTQICQTGPARPDQIQTFVTGGDLCRMYLFAVQSFPQQHISSHPSRPLDKKVAYLKAIWQTDCCTMQLLNARVTKTTFNIVLCWTFIHYLVL